MIDGLGVLKNEEKAIYTLRSLYKQYGYSLYKVSKFEEYDLYAHNKNFLVSQNILSFTDTNGKLLALKPDVTLSIVKNLADGTDATYKLCYNENVYRTAADSDGFREIMQTGLECIGQIDRYAECEVIMLAMKSLGTISSDFMLDLSHRGMIDGLFDAVSLAPSDRSELVRLMECKNTHAIRDFCRDKSLDRAWCQKICTLTELYAPIEQAIEMLTPMIDGEKMSVALKDLKEIGNLISAYGLSDRLYLDFSIVSDVNYYDGISFKGYINGIPESVLSGGRYDRMLKRLGKKMGAIGFAVYLDRLERFESSSVEYDVDAVLLYDETVEPSDLLEAQRSLYEKYSTVMTARKIDPALRVKTYFELTEGGIKNLEAND
jgi:ATP phosphoribosyltransferase regulatory subunit